MYERQLVQDLCAPGGARVAPNQEILDEFTRKCESLNAAKIAENLHLTLQTGTWQQKVKVLHALDACIEKQLDVITGDVVERGSSDLQACLTVPQAKQKATKVLAALGIVDGAASGTGSGHPSPQLAQGGGEVDLLDMGGPTPNSNGNTTKPGNINEQEDLLGLGVVEDNIKPPAPAPRAGAQTSGGDLDDLLGLGGSSSGVVPVVNNSNSPSSAAKKNSGGGLFGNLNMKSSAGGTTKGNTNTVAGGGAASDDLLSLDATTVATSTVTQLTPPSDVSNSSDLQNLLGVGGNNNTTMMASEAGVVRLVSSIVTSNPAQQII